MSENQESCSPLLWNEEFQLLLKHIEEKSRLATVKRRLTLLRYHTAIAIGGYLGPRPKELLHFRWNDLIGKSKTKIYQFKVGSYRKATLDPHLIGYVEQNFQLIDPTNIHDYIMEGASGEPISTRAFNKMFRKLLLECEIETDNASCNTLRKTYALRVYRKYEEMKNNDPDGRLIDPMQMTSKHLGHKSTEYTKDYLMGSRIMKEVGSNLH